MTYAVGYFLKFGGMDQEIFEMQQSMLWEALDGLDKFTDDLKDGAKSLSLLVDDANGCINILICNTIGNYLSKRFNDYKSTLNSRASGVTTACNKLLRYIEQGM